MTRQRDGQTTYTLSYDDHKNSRFGETIPLMAETAQAVLAWEDRRDELRLGPLYNGWLFPSVSVGRRAGAGHLREETLQLALRRLAGMSEVLNSDEPDPASPTGFRPYTGPVSCHRLRHNYAQLLADSGVPLEITSDLMGHRSLDTTRGYYSTSDKRKRAAVMLAAMSVDRNGAAAPVACGTDYALRSVDVPFGSCTNEVNVRSGGTGCPIRFQCLSCSHYRADPSRLESLREHRSRLRGNLVLAERAGLSNEIAFDTMRSEIEQVTSQIEALESQLQRLDDEGRDAVAQAVIDRYPDREDRALLPLEPKATR